jgi:outer membrane lipoprotein-sorting protein
MRTSLILIACAAQCGCEAPRVSQGDPNGAFTIRTNEIMDRCVDAYAKARTLSASGTFRDYRTENRRVVPIRWDFARPGKCRLQIDMEVAIVIGDHWWVYDAESGQYKKRRSFTRTPMETAGYLLARGVSFLTPAVFARGEAAFGKSRTRGYLDWKLLGVAWLHERPCYVVAKSMAGKSTTSVLRVWIDQDSYLVRGWDIVGPGDDGREQTVLACMYHELAVNGVQSGPTFELTAPAALGRAPEPRRGSAGKD